MRCSKQSLETVNQHLISFARPCLVYLFYTGSKMCKFNQVSEWQSRPLRKSQVHYAALDSFVLLVIYSKLLESPEAEEEILYTDNQKI